MHSHPSYPLSYAPGKYSALKNYYQVFSSEESFNDNGSRKIEKRLLCLIHVNNLKKIRLESKLKKKNERIWVKNIFRNRERYETFNTLFQELKNDEKFFFRCTQVTSNIFNHLFELVRNGIEKQQHSFKKILTSKSSFVYNVAYFFL